MLAMRRNPNRPPPRRRLWLALAIAIAILWSAAAGAQELGESCTATALNRTVRIAADGGFALGNVPVPVGAFRVRVVCEDDNGVETGQSGFLFGIRDGVTPVGAIDFGAEAPIPESIEISAPVSELIPPVTGVQLVTTGALADGSRIDLTLAASGTAYLSSNPAIATVTADGFVNAVSSGRALMTATHVGVIATFAVTVLLGDDSDGDGLPDDFERQNAVNPGGANLARGAGVEVIASSSSGITLPQRVADGDLLTSWFTASGDAANLGSTPFVEVILPEDASVAQIRLFGDRQTSSGFFFFAGRFEVFDGAGGVLLQSGVVPLLGPRRDGALPVDLDGVRRVRFTGTDDEGPSPGLAELQLISRPGGPGLDAGDPGDAAADFDQDGLSNLEEFELGTDIFLADSDGDGIADAAEGPLGSSPVVADSDGDGLVDGDELQPAGDADGDGTINILDADSDNDGLPDGLELRLGLDPLRSDTDGNGQLDGSEDADGDGLANGNEVIFNTDPLNPDSDGDSLSDLEETTPGADGFATDPLRPDSDRDGMDDAFESFFGLDPTDPSDADLDADGDGATNLEEFTSGSDPTGGAAVTIIGPVPGATVFAGEPFAIDVVATDRVAGVTVDFLIDGSLVSTDSERPFQLLTTPPAGSTELTLGAEAFDPAGNRAIAEEVTVLVGAEPLTTAIGVVVDDLGGPLPGLTVAAPPDLSALTGADGSFTLAGVTAARGVIRITVEAVTDGVRTVRRSPPLDPVIGGITDFGAITFVPRAVAPVFPGQRFPVEDSLTEITRGDFDGDGATDVAAIVNDGFSVLLGYGDGTFQDELFFPTTHQPGAIGSADMNGDGNLDLVSTGFSPTQAQVLLGHGDGTFSAAPPTEVFGFLGALTVADFDGDGATDVAASDLGRGEVAVLLGGGDGTLAPARRFAAGNLPDELTHGDFDNDGAPDLAVVASSQVLVLLGDGSGDFSDPFVFQLAPNNRPQKIAATDFDGDGFLDLVTANISPSPFQRATSGISILRGLGGGSFAIHLDRVPDTRLTKVRVADVDADGATDIVYLNGLDRHVGVLFGDGALGFPRQENLECGAASRDLALADLDGDGALDVLLSSPDDNNGHVTAFLGVPGGTFSQSGLRSPVLFADIVGESFLRDVKTADFDGDGTLDAAVSISAGTSRAAVVPGNGDGSFRSPQVLTTGSDSEGVAVADLDGDGAQDLVLTNRGDGDVSVFLGRGDGSFEPERRLDVGSGPSDLALGDLDDDGVLDLVAATTVSASSSGRVAVLVGDGAGGFTLRSSLAAGNASKSVALADFDLDGRLDIVVSDDQSNSGVMIFYGGGNATFEPRQTVLPRASGKLLAADLDRDGDPDLVVGPARPSNSFFMLEILVLLGRGDRTFEPPVAIPPRAGDGLAVGDVNLDGIADLTTVIGDDDATLLLFLGRGDGSFQPALRFAAGSIRAGAVTLADLNADGANDFLTADATANQSRLAVSLNRFPDSDRDGLSDSDEAAIGTDPGDPDSDDDGLLDGFEVAAGFDPLSGGDATGDPDGDGLDNLGEQTAGTDPRAPDSDGDGLSDGDEVNLHGSDPTRFDSDGDGLSDGDEINLHGTDPSLADSDGDGLSDSDEIEVHGTDPTNPDSDGGGASDGQEVLIDGTDPLDPGDDAVAGETIALPVDLFDALGFLWDVQQDGEIGIGTDGAFGGGPAGVGAASLRLEQPISGTFPEVPQALVQQGGRELVLGPYSEPLEIGELTIRRRVFASPDDGFVRYLEILEHDAPSPVTVRLRIQTLVGSSFLTEVVATSSGDLSFTTADDYLVSDDFENGFGVPAVAQVFSGPEDGGDVIEPVAVQGGIEVSTIFFTFELAVAPGERVILMHFLAQRAAAADAQTIANTLRSTPESALVGITAEERRQIVNFDP